MSFDSYGVGKSDSGKKTVDFDAMNRYVVEKAGLQERETVAGYIGQIVDLGTQELPDAENKFTGTEEDERKEIAKSPDTYFKDGYDYEAKQKVRLKCYPQKPQQCIAIAVDFPDILIDKGEFFGESKPLPLRLWMGGQFYIENTGMVVARPTPLRVVNLDKSRQTKVWSMALNSMPYQMAVAAKLIKAGEPFLPQRIDELLGKSFQFSAQVFMKAGKDKKEYYNEYIKFVGALGRGQKECEHVTTPYLVQFNRENDDAAIKELRKHVLNTLQRATNYDGSKIKEQIEAVRSFTAAPTQKPAEVANDRDDDFDQFDDDIPF
jgi:hypothetical protein